MKTRNLEILIKKRKKKKLIARFVDPDPDFVSDPYSGVFCWCHYFRRLKNYLSLKENCFCKFFLSSKLTTYPGSGSKLGQNSGSGSKIQCI